MLPCLFRSYFREMVLSPQRSAYFCISSKVISLCNLNVKKWGPRSMPPWLFRLLWRDSGTHGPRDSGTLGPRDPRTQVNSLGPWDRGSVGSWVSEPKDQGLRDPGTHGPRDPVTQGPKDPCRARVWVPGSLSPGPWVPESRWLSPSAPFFPDEIPRLSPSASFYP